VTPFASAHATLSAAGFHTLPLIPPSADHGGRGKAPGEYRSGRWQGMPRWQRFRDQTLSDFDLRLAMSAPDANIGIVCGSPAGPGMHVVVLDFDAADADALDTLIRAAPASPMRKRGAKGESRFYRAAKTLKTRSYDGPDGRLLDVLTGFDTRQTVVPPSIHPDTGQAYVWTGQPVPARELPVLTEEDMAALEEALEQCGWERGGNRTNRTPRPKPDSVPDDDWSTVKAAALANLSAWVPALDLYNCKPARGGYEAVESWRASGTGRHLSERKRNLSIQPDGIKDWGSNNTYSAIDLVMAARDCAEGEALGWLEERLGLAPPDVVLDLQISQVQPDDDLPEPLRPRPVVDQPRITKPVVDHKPPTRDPQSAPLSCPGLVGDIARWICDSALQPQPLGALMAALMVVGTAAGRTFSGPTRTGTHLYGLFLAPSGAAKDHPLKCADRLLRAAGLGNHVGPGEFMSMSALISRLNRQPLTLTCVDEFGDYLARINGRKASPHEKAITRTLRSAWGSSFETMATPEWAGRVGEPIFSPALSLFGVSTHEAFFKGLDGDDVFNGFLNRFLIFTTDLRVEEGEPSRDKNVVPEEISDALAAIAGAVPPLARATSHNAQSDGPAIVLPWRTESARLAYLAYRQTCMRREDDAVFYTRSAEIAQRLAAIRAIGMDGARAAISLDDMDWGVALADESARQTVEMARDYMSVNQQQADARRVLRTIRQARGGLKHSDLVRAMQHSVRARELADILSSLEQSGEIRKVPGAVPPSGGRAPVTYMVV